MPLDAGDAQASKGMSLALYTEINTLLSKPIEAAAAELTGAAKQTALENLETARTSWKELSYAISLGLIEYLKANMEIVGVQTRGDVSASVSGMTGPGGAPAHPHPVALTATQSAVTFKQSNDGTGHVK